MNWHELTCGERDALMRGYLIEGEKAYSDYKQITDCPYREDKQEAVWWRRGFGNARLGALLDTRH